jgi:hypothetical protein
MDNVNSRTLTNHRIANLLHLLTHELRDADHMTKPAGSQFLSSVAMSQLNGERMHYSHQLTLSYTEVRILFYQLVIANMREVCSEV